MDPFTKIGEKPKPVLIRRVDGGPDQNPHNAKVIAAAVKQFRKYDFDVLIVETNAPSRSCYNPVERCMAPLSKKLVGVILPHDKCGTHLDAQRRTVDKELEKKNFAYAGNVLSEIWSELEINNFKTYASYVDPEDSDIECPEEPSQEWISIHCRISQYVLQIVKCENKKCCKKFRSDWLSVVPNHFMPPPIRVSNESKKLKLVRDHHDSNAHFLDFSQAPQSI